MSADVWSEQIHTKSLNTAPEIPSALPSIPRAHLQKLQQVDPTLGPVWMYWEKGHKPTRRQLMQLDKSSRRVLKYWDKISVCDGVLYRTVISDGKEVKQLLLPESLKKQVLTSIHDEMGHQGSEKTLQLARTRCYWAFMAKDVEHYCRDCQRCILAKAQTAKTTMGSLIAKIHSKFWLWTTLSWGKVMEALKMSSS